MAQSIEYDDNLINQAAQKETPNTTVGFFDPMSKSTGLDPEPDTV
jgi:hypothetical protein